MGVEFKREVRPIKIIMMTIMMQTLSLISFDYIKHSTKADCISDS